ncbi:MAG: metal-dependent transcriptional regulator, partial [Enterococcus hulanensis]
ELGGDKEKVSNKKIVAGLSISGASVSEMINKLVKEGLVEHSPYQGVQLTPAGLEKASTLVRKHRLWEVFLVDHLGYSWNEVHDEAEVLEHVTSSQLEQKLDNYLKQPTFCPHGGMIPQQDQIVHEKDRQTLANYPEGTIVRIARVLDEKDLLDYLMDLGIKIHEEYTITNIAAYEGPITLANDQKEVAISYKAASTIFVDTL